MLQYMLSYGIHEQRAFDLTISTLSSTEGNYAPLAF